MASEYIKLAILTGDSFWLLAAQEEEDKKVITEEVVFDFDTYDENRFTSDFRFEKLDVLRLKEALRIPDWLRTLYGVTFKGIDGLCLMLRRLAYPCRLVDLQLIFGRSKSSLSQIFNCMIYRIHRDFKHLTSDVNQFWLDKEHLTKYADAIKSKNAPLKGCFGFVDGTVVRICRPKYYQKEFYSGYKRTHCVKYQSLVLPNGLIGNLFGDVGGRRHDTFLLTEGKTLDKLDQIIGEDNFCIYGDAGYPIKRHLIVPYPTNASQDKIDFNTAMSAVRIAVEWEFNELTEQWAFLRYKYNLKVFMQPIGKYVVVATILHNAQACLYGNQTSAFFKCKPPTLENYLSNQRE